MSSNVLIGRVFQIAQSMHDGLGKEELVANIPELQDLSADMLDTRYVENRIA